jgi:hypothetical protein
VVRFIVDPLCFVPGTARHVLEPWLGAMSWIRGKTDAATIMFLYLWHRIARRFPFVVQASFAQMSVTAQFTDSLSMCRNRTKVPLLA